MATVPGGETLMSGVPAGDYTLTFTVNPQHEGIEAYFYNNTRTVCFKVRDSYVVGDYDDIGAVEILDVSLMQRRLCALTVDVDKKADERGNVDDGDLLITDATWIRRSIAGIEPPLSDREKEPVQGYLNL